MLPDADLLPLLRSRRPGGPLPRAFYCAPEAHEADLRHVWAREWVFAASAPLGLVAGASADDLRRALEGKELASGTVVGTYQR